MKTASLSRAVALSIALVAGASSLVPATAQAADDRTIGIVDTTFKLLTRDDDIIVEAYDDPLVQGVTCYVPAPAASRARWVWPKTRLRPPSPAIRLVRSRSKSR